MMTPLSGIVRPCCGIVPTGDLGEGHRLSRQSPSVETLNGFRCKPERLLFTGEEGVFYPVVMGRLFAAIFESARKEGTESGPIRMLAALQILPRFGDGFFKRSNALQYSLLLRVHLEVLRVNA